MVAILVILLLTNTLTIYLVILGRRREEELQNIYETDLFEVNDFLSDTLSAMSDTYYRIKNIDKKGMFEGDDEVGWVWKEMYESIEKLNKEYNTKLADKWEESDNETTLPQ